MTIKELIEVSFKPVLSYMRQGKTFVDDDLNRAYAEGRIRTGAMGVSVEDYAGNIYPIQALEIPAIWTNDDELRNPTDHQKIWLAKQLIENHIHSHDDLLLEILGDGDLFISDIYLYNLGPVAEMEDVDGYMVKLSTAYAKLPRMRRI